MKILVVKTMVVVVILSMVMAISGCDDTKRDGSANTVPPGLSVLNTPHVVDVGQSSDSEDAGVDKSESKSMEYCWINCSYCGTSGECGYCYDVRYGHATGRCSACFGSGQKYSVIYDDGVGEGRYIDCSLCEGSGICHVCSGSGACFACNGKGKWRVGDDCEE